MKSVYLSFKLIDEAKDFVNVISKMDGDFDLVSGRYIVNAKSILGIFSLDWSKPIRLDIHDDEAFDKLMPHIKDNIVEQ